MEASQDGQSSTKVNGGLTGESNYNEGICAGLSVYVHAGRFYLIVRKYR